MTHIIVILIFFLHQGLDYSQMYCFVFNHDDKFWTFFTIKDV
jgi:hypothetical protein